jgi:hypothetical protein
VLVTSEDVSVEHVEDDESVVDSKSNVDVAPDSARLLDVVVLLTELALV